MKTIERLRELKKDADTPTQDMGHRMAARLRYNAAVNDALPALLAVVEAQAAEIEAWRAFSNGAEDSNWREAWEDHGNACCAAEENTDAALRALEGEG